MGLFQKKYYLSDDQRRWNAIWDLWAEEKARSPYAELMTYQSEMDHGGHEDYFENMVKIGNLPYEISVLEQILPVNLKKNLQKAYKAYLVLQVNKEDEKSTKYLRKEFSYTRFEQSLMLPENVDRDGITAKACHGILRIELPKIEKVTEKEPARVIEIE
jgi:hypothetical protein